MDLCAWLDVQAMHVGGVARTDRKMALRQHQAMHVGGVARTHNVGTCGSVLSKVRAGVLLTAAVWLLLSTEVLASGDDSPLCAVGHYARWNATTVAGTPGDAGLFVGVFGGLALGKAAFSPDGRFIVVADNGNHQIRLVDVSSRTVVKMAGDGTIGTIDGLGTNARFAYPRALSFGGSSFFLVGQANRYIRMVEMTVPVVTTIKNGQDEHGSNFVTYYGVAVSPDGSQYVTEHRDQLLKVLLYNMSTGVLIRRLVECSPAGGLMDGGLGQSMIGGTSGDMSFSPDGGHIAYADYTQHAIRLISVATSVTTTLAGDGTPGYVDGTQARFDDPLSVAWSPDGDFLVVADRDNHAVRMITLATGSVSTLVGSRTPGYADGSPALFGKVTGVSFDPTSFSGSPVLAIADAGNNLVRRVHGPSCAPCDRGTSNNSTGQTACASCARGKFANVTGRTACASCPRGKFTNVTGQTACTSCPLGSFNDVPGLSACAPCEAGMHTNAIGQSVCSLCGIGEYKASTGTGTCGSCPVGTYSDRLSGDGLPRTCVPCPSFSNTSTVGSNRAQCYCKSGFEGSFFGGTTDSLHVLATSVRYQSLRVADYWSRQNGWIVVEKVTFPSSVQDSIIFVLGGNFRGVSAGIRDTYLTPVFRVRAGYTNHAIEKGHNYVGSAYFDLTDFPRDDKNHSIAIFIKVNCGIVLFIDDVYKGEGGCSGSLGGGRWVGGSPGSYGGTSYLPPTDEPGTEWPSYLGTGRVHAGHAYVFGLTCTKIEHRGATTTASSTTPSPTSSSFATTAATSPSPTFSTTPIPTSSPGPAPYNSTPGPSVLSANLSAVEAGQILESFERGRISSTRLTAGVSVAVGGALLGASLGSVGGAAVSASISGSASASANVGGGSAIPALIDQVQFLTLLGQVGGNTRSLENAANSTKPTKDSAEIAAFSDGLQWANFDVWPEPSRRSLQDEESTVETGSKSVYGDSSPYTADDLYHSNGLIWERCPDFSDIVNGFWQRIVSPPPTTPPVVCVIVLVLIGLTRAGCRAVQMKIYPNAPPPPDMAFPGWEGPVLLAQVFGITDVCMQLVSPCSTGRWRIVGIFTFILGPLLFLIVVVYQVRGIFSVQKTLTFTRMPPWSAKAMRESVIAAPNLSSKLSQLWIIFIELRFVGNWAKSDAKAKFYGFLMANYTDSFWLICAWVLFRKIADPIIKNLLTGSANAGAVFAIRCMDLVIFAATRPFRDRWITYSQIITSVCNIWAITAVALPIISPDFVPPPFLSTDKVVAIASAATAILSGAAVIDALRSLFAPLISALGKLGGQAGKTFVGHLWGRFQAIVFMRTYKAAQANVKSAQDKAAADSEVGQDVEDTEPDSKPVKIQLILDMDIRDVAADEEGFKRTVEMDVARSVCDDASKVRVLSIEPGSIIVNILLDKDLRGDAQAAALDLQQQADDPNSQLKQGVCTRATLSVKIVAQPAESTSHVGLLKVSYDSMDRKFDNRLLALNNGFLKLFKPEDMVIVGRGYCVESSTPMFSVSCADLQVSRASWIDKEGVFEFIVECNDGNPLLFNTSSRTCGEEWIAKLSAVQNDVKNARPANVENSSTHSGKTCSVLNSSLTNSSDSPATYDAANSAESGVFSAAVNPDPTLPVPFDWYARRRGGLEDKLSGLSFTLKQTQIPPNLSVDSKADSSEFGAQVDLVRYDRQSSLDAHSAENNPGVQFPQSGRTAQQPVVMWSLSQCVHTSAHLQTQAPGGEAGMKNSGSPSQAMSGNVLRLLRQSSKSNLLKLEARSGY